ncbi:flavonol sulfotransferase-like protein [Trifolium medium]|uniref:Flavonol sulfotransferase-like protein n=1 Tax=Trifolium medium TaxID=97028 RepID=A0A392MJZ7_9FABA|nr:flavonol sulfotransferase-like protein [Trifolium medium]
MFVSKSASANGDSTGCQNKGSNYHSWSCTMTVALRSKHKLHFINGSLHPPSYEDYDSIAWDR